MELLLRAARAALLVCLSFPCSRPWAQAGERETNTMRQAKDTSSVSTAASSATAALGQLPEEDNEETFRVQTKGFLDTYHAMRTEQPCDWMASRTRARGEISVERGTASLFISLNATYNAILPERTGIQLREAFITYAQGNFDLRIGRQIIVWGVADALRVADCVSPCDYTEFLAQDYDDIRMPVNALRARYTVGSVTFEALCNPIVNFFVLPTDGRNPWALRPPSSPLPYTIDLEEGKPKPKIENVEYGGRLIANLSGGDITLSALRTWNKQPALCPGIAGDGQSILINGRYLRMTMVAADGSLPLGQFVLRAEAALYIGEAQSVLLGHNVQQRNVMNALVGIDWYPGNDWIISLQYFHKHLFGNMEGIASYRNAGIATARISKDLLRSTLKLSTFAYVDVADGALFNRLSIAYSLNDQIELAAGYDLLHAQRGKLAIYGKNSEAWIKAKYSF